MPIKAILFDFGEVVYEQPAEVISEVITRIYDQPLETALKEYKKYKGDYFVNKIKTNELIRLLSSAFKSSKSVNEVKSLWIKYYGELVKSNKEVLDIIEQLRKKYKVYLFSNTTEMSDLYNSKTGIYNYFDDLFFSFKMGMKKPNLEIYDKVISSIGFKPQECIFIDNSSGNLETASHVGLKTIFFNVLTDPIAVLKEKLKKFGAII